MSTRSVKCATLALLCGGIWASPSSAQDFRMVTKIYEVAKNETLLSENLTIFSGGRVYDFFVNGDSETTIYDPQPANKGPGRFILLDNARKTMTEIKLDELAEFSAAITERARQSSQLLRAAADPQFTETFDEQASELGLSNDHLNYRVVVQDVSQDIATKFRDFADWYARLNATNKGALPPLARLELNKALASRQKIPRLIRLTITQKSGLSKNELKLRSEHKFAWKTLPTGDRKRIDTATGNISRYKKVSLSEFRGLKSPLARSPASRR